MDAQEAREIIGDRARWELIAMRRALTFCAALNSPEEHQRLNAVKVLLKSGGD